MIDKLSKLIDDGWDIHLTTEAKRMEGEDGWRDFFARVCWTAVKDSHSDDVKKQECKWEGFATAKEAIEDLIKKVK